MLCHGVPCHVLKGVWCGVEDVLLCRRTSLGFKGYGRRQLQQPSRMAGGSWADGLPFVGLGYEVGSHSLVDRGMQHLCAAGLVATCTRLGMAIMAGGRFSLARCLAVAGPMECLL